jgi:branched-chain amino acid transport system permease protein
VLGAVLERTLYRPLYRKPHLDQVLFSIGLVFMAVAAVDYYVGSTQQIMQLPAWLKGRTEIGSLGMGHYRLFIIAVCAALTVVLQFILAAPASAAACAPRSTTSASPPAWAST